jgi:hypothetical protein
VLCIEEDVCKCTSPLSQVVRARRGSTSHPCWEWIVFKRRLYLSYFQVITVLKN